MAIVKPKTNPQSTGSQSAAVAIENAAKAYNVPPDLLYGIWQNESSRSEPNPYGNSSGYGGMFGTSNWASGPTFYVGIVNGQKTWSTNNPTPPQQQAYEAAKVLSETLAQNHGNVALALNAYSGGGYSSVPGQTTTGVIANYNPGKGPGSGGFENTVVGAAATGFNTIFNGTGINSTDIGLPASNSLQSDALNAALPSISGVGKEVLYGIALLGGGLMVIAGLLLIGVDIGLGAYRGTKRNPTVQVITTGASKTRDRFKPKPEEESPVNKPVSLAERREQRQADLHRAKLRRARAEARIREHQATEAKHRGQRARSVTEQETANLNIFK